jgi:hypothetical protein
MRTAVTHLMERIDSQDITIASGGTTNHAHFQKPGYLRGITYSLNDNTNGVTSIISIEDDQGVQLYASSALTHNTSGYLTPTDVVLVDALHSVKVTSADPGVSTNIATVTLLIER